MNRTSRRLLLFVPVLTLFSIFVFAGLRGVDFGNHWDEVEWHIQPVRDMVASGLFLPRAYIYPSLSKWLVMLPTLPVAVLTALKTGGDPKAIQLAMGRVANGSDFLLTAREVFIVVSALAIIWVYGAVLALRRTAGEAIIAAACLALSWEYGYHARWVANDCILTQFAALMLLCLALFRRTKRERWLYMAAISVGLGTGAKQPGVFLLLAVLLASALSLPLGRPYAQIRRAMALCGVAFAAFVVTTPGAILDPFIFLSDARRISTIYGAGHGQFTATGAYQHWQWVVTYLSVSFLSPWHAVALVLTACAVLGGVQWLRQDFRFAAQLLIFPLCFLGVFCSRYVVMIARNYLQITPFLALFVARGVLEVFELVRNYWVRLGLVSALTVTAIAQAIWVLNAAETIRHIDPNAYVREALAYVAAHPKEQFRISKKVKAAARQQRLTLPANAVNAPLGQAVVMFGQSEMGDPGLYKENDPWLTDEVFGPREVNFNWYAVWGGHDRVVVMPIAKARAGHVPMAAD